MSERIDYDYSAEGHIKAALQDHDAEDALVVAQIATAEAMLALVEQQRIANLIAYIDASAGISDGHKEWIETELGL